MFAKAHLVIKKLVLGIITAFYPLFRKFMPAQTFRYAVCGGGNAVLNFTIFSITENIILKKQVVHIIPNVAISSHIFSFLVAFSITFPIGFYLNTYVVFDGSYLQKRIQLFRYFTIVIVCFLLNYLFMKLFVDRFGWYPTPSYILTFFVVTLFSYFSQRNFTFKKKLG
ncbi:GtrA family protein [Pedobacter sp. SD-b]|uniref:GtrA family protein n=1 Tax=Pedobacter segetis TaxID=2793069 RepID=A0ABS1BMA8_9SPHI|nr:GtrA family protein [Pedobacter segetis]MBK0384033.1 GtrA family protein [Pedobacter segetis]